MYQKIRITVVSLMAIAISVLSSIGTLSYFTDTDVTTNEFTVGNASTTLSIYSDTNKTPLDTSEPLVDDGNGNPFYLQATNDGNIPVYQRFRVVIPKDLAESVTLKLSDQNCNNESTNPCSSDDYTVTYKKNVADTYAEYYIVSTAQLGVNQETAIVETVLVVNDNDAELFECPEGDSSNNNCKLKIKAYSDAIQTAGFTDAVQAFEGFAEIYN